MPVREGLLLALKGTGHILPLYNASPSGTHLPTPQAEPVTMSLIALSRYWI